MEEFEEKADRLEQQAQRVQTELNEAHEKIDQLQSEKFALTQKLADQG